MNKKDENKLDNPVWHSLSEIHQKFVISYKNIKFYQPEYCPFGGFNMKEDISTPVLEYSKLIDNFFVVGERPEIPEGLKLKRELICLQMIIDSKINTTTREDIRLLTDEHTNALYNLVTLVQPGYFRQSTRLLGNYFGIFKDGQLVSAAGERMKMNGFSEVSAIVTHPGYTGKGYAKQLVAHTVNSIFDQFNTPYLHVAETNSAAISLYEKSGFFTRRKISFWNFTT